MGKPEENPEVKNMMEASLVSKGADNGQLEGFASYKSVDRYGDLVLPSAFNATIPKFLKNPLFCLGHDSSGNGGEAGLPIGSVRSMVVTQDGVKFVADFADHALAQTVRKLFQDGHMRAFSIGFWIRGQRDPTEEESKDYGPKLRRVVTEIELAEISAVPLPACREALMISVRGMSGSQEDRLAIKGFLSAMTDMMNRTDAPAPAPDKWQTAVTGSYKAVAESFGKVGAKAAGLEAAKTPAEKKSLLSELDGEIAGFNKVVETLKSTAGAWAADLEAESKGNDAPFSLEAGTDLLSALRGVGAAH